MQASKCRDLGIVSKLLCFKFLPRSHTSYCSGAQFRRHVGKSSIEKVVASNITRGRMLGDKLANDARLNGEVRRSKQAPTQTQLSYKYWPY
eukprot:2410027-Amphidinium_carterae.1